MNRVQKNYMVSKAALGGGGGALKRSLAEFDITPKVYSVKTSKGYRLWGELDMVLSIEKANLGGE
jgi:hypothetical protein